MLIYERIPKFVYQLQIQSTNEQGMALCRAVLLNLGYGQGDLVNSIVKAKPGIELFDEHETKLKRVKELFGRLSLTGVKVHYRRLTPQDWLTRWKRQWKPAPLTKKLDVVP